MVKPKPVPVKVLALPELALAVGSQLALSVILVVLSVVLSMVVSESSLLTERL